MNPPGFEPLVVALRNDTPVRIRLVRPDDRWRLKRGVEEMSGTSRYMRFFASTRSISDEQARYFTEIDHVNHVAVCAVEPTDAEEQGYGISRFVRDIHDARIAEFAVAVIDRMQRRGLGTILMAALYLRAQAAGIHALHGEVLAENQVMPQWMARLGATVSAVGDSEYCSISWPVLPPNALPVPGTSSNFVWWLERLRPSLGRAGSLCPRSRER